MFQFWKKSKPKNSIKFSVDGDELSVDYEIADRHVFVDLVTVLFSSKLHNDAVLDMILQDLSTKNQEVFSLINERVKDRVLVKPSEYEL